MKRTPIKRKYKDRIPAAVRREVWERDGGVCVDCGGFGDHRREVVLSHTIHAGMGGNPKAHTADNIKLRCAYHHDIFDLRLKKREE